MAATTTPTTPPVEAGRLSALRVLEYCALVYRRNWRGTLFSTFLTPVLFLTAMGSGLGSFVNAGAGAQAVLGGLSYAAFLAPGLLAATGMQTASFESTYQIMARFRWNRVYHAMLSTPIDVTSIVIGQLAWIAVRLTLVCGVFFGAMVAFGLASPLAFPAIGAAVLTGLAFAAPIIAYTATQRNDSGFSGIFRFIIMPLYLFSGTFFPITQLPGFLQQLALLTPTYHGVALARDIVLGRGDALSAAFHVGLLATFILTGAVVARTTFRRALRD
jgi:lipooligosaccharide transport system permease protein